MKAESAWMWSYYRHRDLVPEENCTARLRVKYVWSGRECAIYYCPRCKKAYTLSNRARFEPRIGAVVIEERVKPVGGNKIAGGKAA